MDLLDSGAFGRGKLADSGVTIEDDAREAALWEDLGTSFSNAGMPIGDALAVADPASVSLRSL